MSRRRGMVCATWNGTVIAESDDTVVVEGNHYFPRSSITAGSLLDSSTRSLCPWKGMARYHSVQVDGVVAVDAAWYYPHPSPFARRVKGRVAFWNGVVVETVPPSCDGDLGAALGG